MVAPSSTSITLPLEAGASVAPGASVAGISVAGASVAGGALVAGAWVSAEPQADSAKATTSRMLNNAVSLLFILFLSLSFSCFCKHKFVCVSQERDCRTTSFLRMLVLEKRFKQVG